MADDDTSEDVDMDVKSEEGSLKGTIGQGKTQDGSNVERSFPIQLNILITTPGKGTLLLKVAAGNDLVIEGLQLYRSAEKAHRAVSAGNCAQYTLHPPEHSGNRFNDYLEERGINSELLFYAREVIVMEDQVEVNRQTNSM
jgi:hypothetical protein